MHRIFVEYDGGINQRIDDRISKAANYDFCERSPVTCNSGCSMTPPYTRDLVFQYDSSSMAISAEKKLNGIPLIRVRLELAS